MFDQWFTEMGLSSWQAWIIPVAGVASCLLIVFLSSVFLGRRKKRPPGPPASPPAVPSAPPKIAERRENHRREGAPVAIDVTSEDFQAQPFRGWVVDRSVGGLCIEVHDTQPEGIVLGIRPISASAQVPWTQIEVRSCRQSGDRWQLGCQFVRTPPYTIMMLFG